MPLSIEKIRDLPVRRYPHPQKRHLFDLVAAVLGGGNPRTGEKRRAPLEEHQQRRRNGHVRLTTSPPEPDEILPFAECPVQELVCDIAAAPSLDLGLGSPSPVAQGVPELAIATTERNGASRRAGKACNVRRRQERDDAELNIIGKIRERQRFISHNSCCFLKLC
ncbi:hypothetical protein SLE2022_323950 [Rubroshorea leprosula]